MNSSITWLAALSGFLCLGCADIHEPSKPGVSNPRLSVDGGPEMAADTGSIPSESNRSTRNESDDVPELRRVVAPKTDDPRQVWVGELWSFGFHLCNADEEVPLELEAQGDVTRVVLSFEPNETGEVGAQIQFGELDGREVPDAPRDYARGSLDGTTPEAAFWVCSVQLPTRGFAYPLLELERTSNRVSFEFVPNLLWDSFCRSSKPECPLDTLCQHLPFCECEEGACQAERKGGFRVSLEVDGDLMEGSFANGPYGALRLRRVY